MDWLKNRTIRWYAVIGFIGGLLFLFAGYWLALDRQNLPLARWVIPYVHRTDPLVFLLDLAPFLFGTMASLLGSQVHLSATVIQAKRELETVFDAISDLILVTDSDGRILRCNHAVVDRLHTTFFNVIGKPLAELLSLSGLDELGQ